MAAPPPPRPAAAPHDDLLLDMRRATRRLHNLANALILSKLVVVLTDARLYAKALGQFLPVYEALDDAIAAQRRTLAGSSADEGAVAAARGLAPLLEALEGLRPRSEAMRDDLQALLGPSWRERVPPSAAAAAYAQHLRALSRGGGDGGGAVLLLPYVFSLHVPILLGFLARRIGRALNDAPPPPAASSGGDDSATGGGGGGGKASGSSNATIATTPQQPGMAFFTVDDREQRLARLRAAVTAAGRALDADTRAAVVAEACEQFRRNNAVVAEFAVGWAAVAAAARRAAAALPGWAAALLLALWLAAVWAAAGALLGLGRR